jgi:hypothetical protein
MGVSGGPNIIRDSSLVLELDAADRNSYPGSGTTWTDLTANNNSGSLVNGPTFSSANLGSIVFDGSNDYCSFTSGLSITVGSTSIWFKTSNAGSSFRALINKSNSWGLFLQDNILITYDWGNAIARTTGLNLATNTWQNAAMTFSETIGTPSNNTILYVNGTSVLTTTVKYLDAFAFQIAAQNTSQNFLGNIANAQVYNRVLSASEVLQNYNAIKSRFNL